MPFCGFSCRLHANRGNPRLFRASVMAPVLLLFPVDDPVDKFVGGANSENCGESATRVGKLRQQGRKVAIGRPVQPARAEMQEIGVGDDGRPALADPAAREQAAGADCATAAVRPVCRARRSAPACRRGSTAAARARPAHRAAGPNAAAGRCRRRPAAAAAGRRAAVRSAIRARDRQAAAAGRRAAPRRRARPALRPAEPAAGRRAAARRRGRLARQVDGGHPIALAPARSAPASPAGRGRSSRSRRAAAVVSRNSSGRSAVGRRLRPALACAASSREAASDAATASERRPFAGAAHCLLLAVVRSPSDSPGATPSSASGSFGSASALIAAQLLTAARSSLPAADRGAEQDEQENERQAGQSDPYALHVLAVLPDPPPRIDKTMRPLRSMAIARLDVLCANARKAGRYEPHPLLDTLGRRRCASRLQPVRPHHHRQRAADPQANADRRRAGELPPAIAASKTYRCKDNSLVYVDWLSDNKTANVRGRQERRRRPKLVATGKPASTMVAEAAIR